MSMFHENKIKWSEWQPTAVLHPNYHDYAVLIMDSHIQWEPEKMFAVWEKALLTMTVNEGTKVWFTYLLKAGVDIYNDVNRKYVPRFIIMKTIDRALDGQPPTIVEVFESLGSTVLYVPDQDPEDYIRVLGRVSECSFYMHNKVKEVYVFAQKRSPNEIFGADTRTLYKTNGKVFNMRIIIVTHLYFMWILYGGVHKIYVPERQMLLKPMCGLLPDPAFCKIMRCSTYGLERNQADVSIEDMMENPIHTTYMENIVTIRTNRPIIWVNGLNIAEEVLPKASNESTDESVGP